MEDLHYKKWDHIEGIMRSVKHLGFNTLINFTNGELCIGKVLSYSKGSFSENVHIFADIDDIDTLDDKESFYDFKNRINLSFLLERFIKGAEENISRLENKPYDTTKNIKLYKATITKFQMLRD